MKPDLALLEDVLRRELLAYLPRVPHASELVPQGEAFAALRKDASNVPRTHGDYRRIAARVPVPIEAFEARMRIGMARIMQAAVAATLPGDEKAQRKLAALAGPWQTLARLVDDAKAKWATDYRQQVITALRLTFARLAATNDGMTQRERDATTPEALSALRERFATTDASLWTGLAVVEITRLVGQGCRSHVASLTVESAIQAAVDAMPPPRAVH